MRRSFAVIGLAAFAALTAVGFLTGRAVLAAAEPADRPAAVPSAEWVAAAPGLVEPRSGFVRLAAAETGRIAEIKVSPGDRVRAGDILAKLADAEALARVEGAEAVLEAAIDRSSLVQSVEGAASVTIRKEFTVAGEPVQANPTGAGVEAAQAEVNVARVGLEKTLIRAPSDGVVLEVAHRPGELVAPSSDDAVVTMGDVERLAVRAELDEGDAGKVRVGDRAVVRSDARPDARWRGRVVEVAPLVGRRRIGVVEGRSPLSNVQAVRVELDEASDLLPGARVDVFFPVAPES